MSDFNYSREKSQIIPIFETKQNNTMETDLPNFDLPSDYIVGGRVWDKFIKKV